MFRCHSRVMHAHLYLAKLGPDEHLVLDGFHSVIGTTDKPKPLESSGSLLTGDKYFDLSTHRSAPSACVILSCGALCRLSRKSLPFIQAKDILVRENCGVVLVG